jgi:uncharacterized damage-inducible protein DinB
MNDLETSVLQQIVATNAGDPWYGPSRKTLLAGITHDQAASHPVPNGHSIWELVLHMTSWTREVTRRLRGAEPAAPQDGDWPPLGDVSARAWEAAQAALEAAHAELVATARTMPAARWEEAVGRLREPALGTGITVGGMLVGLAQHDAYHSGQIAILRRGLESS